VLIRCIPSDKSCLMLNTDGLVRGLDKLGGCGGLLGTQDGN